MQDYNYVEVGAMEITLELSCCKYPYRHDLPNYWRDNKKALIAYLGEVHRGVRGFVVDPNSNGVPHARLKIKGREIGFRTSSRGEFWRILLPGTYTLEVFAEGYHPAEQKFDVHEGQVTFLNLQLIPSNYPKEQNVLGNWPFSEQSLAASGFQTGNEAGSAASNSDQYETSMRFPSAGHPQRINSKHQNPSQQNSSWFPTIRRQTPLTSLFSNIQSKFSSWTWTLG